MLSLDQFLKALEASGFLAKENLKILNTVGQVITPINFGKNLLGISAIIYLKKSGINYRIKEGQNLVMDQFQNFYNFFKVGTGLEAIAGKVGKLTGHTDTQINEFNSFIKYYTRPENYKANEADIDILELALLQAKIVFDSTDSKALAAAAFTFAGISLLNQKNKLQQQGEDYTLAKLLKALPLNVGDSLGKFAEILGENEDYAFDNEDDPFNQGTDSKKETKSESSEPSKNAVENFTNEEKQNLFNEILKNPEIIESTVTDSPLQIETVFDNTEAEKVLGDTDEFKGLFNTDKFKPVITDDDHFKPFFANDGHFQPVFTF